MIVNHKQPPVMPFLRDRWWPLCAFWCGMGVGHILRDGTFAVLGMGLVVTFVTTWIALDADEFFRG